MQARTGSHLTMEDLVYTPTSNRSLVAHWMQFATLPDSIAAPSVTDVQRVGRELMTSSCAVIGAARRLRKCNRTRDMCKHDIIIQVNHRRFIPCGHRRVDVQVVNAFACMSPHECERPRLFRLRTEWNVERQNAFARGNTWLQSGLLTAYTRDVLTNRVATYLNIPRS